MGAVLGAGDGAVEGVLGALPGALEAGKAGDFGVDLGFVEDQRVAGGERFDLGEAEGVLADVLDLADVEAAAHDLVDEPGFALDGLPAVGVEAPLGGVADDVDLGVLVALAHAAAVALLDVGRAPGAVEVVDRDAPVLDVGPHPHLLRRADQHETWPARQAANRRAFSASLRASWMNRTCSAGRPRAASSARSSS